MDGARRIWKKYIECFGNLYNVITEEKVVDVMNNSLKKKWLGS